MVYYLQEINVIKDLSLLIDIYGHDINIYKIYGSGRDRPARFQLSEPFVIVSHDKKLISLFQFEDAPTSLMHYMFEAVSVLFEMYPDYKMNDTTTSNIHYMRYLELIEEETKNI